MINPVANDLYRSVTHHRGANRQGLIISFNDRSVYVRFNGDSIEVASRREDLEWTHPDKLEAPIEAEP